MMMTTHISQNVSMLLLRYRQATKQFVLHAQSFLKL